MEFLNLSNTRMECEGFALIMASETLAQSLEYLVVRNNGVTTLPKNLHPDNKLRFFDLRDNYLQKGSTKAVAYEKVLILAWKHLK